MVRPSRARSCSTVAPALVLGSLAACSGMGSVLSAFSIASLPAGYWPCWRFTKAWRSQNSSRRFCWRRAPWRTLRNRSMRSATWRRAVAGAVGVQGHTGIEYRIGVAGGHLLRTRHTSETALASLPGRHRPHIECARQPLERPRHAPSDQCSRCHRNVRLHHVGTKLVAETGCRRADGQSRHVYVPRCGPS
jgi:hypothetical protein